MPLLPAAFVVPTGDLRDSLFPDDELAGEGGLLAAWIADAEGRTANEDAQRAWVYHRAYRLLCQTPLAAGTAPVEEIDVDGEARVRYARGAAAPDYCALAAAYLRAYEEAAGASQTRRLRTLSPSRPDALGEYHAGCRPDPTRCYR